MAIQFACPSCQKKLSVDESMAGKRARCKCGESIVIPASSMQASKVGSEKSAVGSSQVATSGGSSSVGSSSTATTGRVAAPVAGKLKVVCAHCKSEYTVDAKHAGRNMKCKCGETMVAPSVAQVPLVKQATKTAAVAVTAPNRANLLDELTESDWGAKVAPVPVSDRAKVSDSEYLRGFVAKSADFQEREEQKQKTPGGLIFIAVLNGLGAVALLVGGIILLAAPGLLPKGAIAGADGNGGSTILMIAGGALIFAALLAAVFTGIILLRQRWVWWLLTTSYSQGAAANSLGLVAILMSGETEQLMKGILSFVVGLAWAAFFWGDPVREYYHVKFPTKYAFLIIGGIVLLLTAPLVALLFF